MILVDSNVLLDVIDNDPQSSMWSINQLRRCSILDALAVNRVVYAEVSPRYTGAANVDEVLRVLEVSYVDIPREAAFLAGKAFLVYRARAAREAASFPISLLARMHWCRDVQF
jgi:predicted nucleic acid-binding protein